jgi:hypothetical protein
MGELADYLVSFAPWLGYVVLTNVLGSWSDGYTLGLGLAFGLVVYRTIRRDSRFLDIGTLCFCAVMTAVSVSDPKSPLRPYNLPLSMAAVSAISVVSLAIRSPFTFRIARLHVDTDILDDPKRLNSLYHAHVAATSWWAGSQFVAASASAICVGARSVLGAAVIQSVGTLLPAGMTRYHHDRAARPPGDDTDGHTDGTADDHTDGDADDDADDDAEVPEASVTRPGGDRLESLGELGELPS